MIFNSGKYDRQHKKDIKRIQMAVKQLLDDAIARGVVIALGTGFDGTLKEMFDFDDFPIAKRLMDELLEEMHGNIYHTIAEGNKTAIDLSNLKNDTMVLSVAAGGTDKIYKIADDILNGTAEYSIPKEWLDHNLVKADAFNNRVVNGMNLSDRVWNITDSFYEDLRMAVDEGMKSGESAQSLSREVRQLLKEPGNLYRRVRNRYGKLVPSKRMRRKKTGKGVYKSSYKNALRLAGTETNIAYRTADHERWNALPFVEGIEISVSHTNHTVPDICDELAGVYPKSFKFVGWHPNCRCYAVAKLPSVEDYEKYREVMANGTDDEFEFDEVTELPDNFKEWYANNEDKINSAKNVPYFIQDNFIKKDGEYKSIIKETSGASFSISGKIDFTKTELDEIKAGVTNVSETTGGMFPKSFSLTTIDNRGTLMSWDSQKNTLRVSNNEFVTDNGSKFCPMRELQSAMGKLISKEPMTFNEEYSLECLFHESIHANKVGLKPTAYNPINNKLIEGCTQIYARQNYVKILDSFGVESTNFNKIKYGGYGYRELVNKLRPFVTDKNGNLIEDDILKIAKEMVYPKDKIISIMKVKNLSKEDIDNFFYSIMY